MAGKLDGPRFGQTKGGIDPIHGAIGDRIRELRIRAGLRQEDLAEAMSAAGYDWSARTVSDVQTGRRRHVKVPELLPLARILGVTVEELLTGAVGEPNVKKAQSRTGALLDDEVVKWSPEMPPFAAYEGQTEEIEELAKRAGVSRNEMGRMLMALSIPEMRRRLRRRRSG
uniref:helix-turn-helix domain-containing protein n=1 Tax=Pseudonocardia sp. CA-138482 TaxID=3240023 RepID=UPI003F49B322